MLNTPDKTERPKRSVIGMDPFWWEAYHEDLIFTVHDNPSFVSSLGGVFRRGFRILRFGCSPSHGSLRLQKGSL